MFNPKTSFFITIRVEWFNLNVSRLLQTSDH